MFSRSTNIFQELPFGDPSAKDQPPKKETLFDLKTLSCI